MEKAMLQRLGGIIGMIILLIMALAGPVMAQIEGMPPELDQFLKPYAFLGAAPVIAFISRYLKQIKDLGKFNFVWAFILSAIFSVGQKFVMTPPIQADWWNIALMTLGTGLISVGVHSTLKNGKQGLTA